MKSKELTNLLISLNAANDLGFKYPIGNQELCELIKKLEAQGLIKYNALTGKWVKL